MTRWNPPVEDPEEWREPIRAPNPVQHYTDWCAAHRMDATAHDNLAAFLRQLVLPRWVRVHMADQIARAMFADRATALMDALEFAGCFS